MDDNKKISAYSAVAERKDHSDSLYYIILNACILVNSALAAGAATVLKSMSSGLDLAIVVMVSVGGLVLTTGFNDYLQHEKAYQRDLMKGLPVENIPEGYPDVFYRGKERLGSDSGGWSRFPGLFALFWISLLIFALVRYFGWLNHA